MKAPRGSLADELARVGREAGLDAIGICDARPFDSTRRTLLQRRARGWAGGMQFTYRNPARATDPQATLPGAAALFVGARRYERADPAEAADLTGPASSTDVPPDRGPQGRVAMYSWLDHYEPLRCALGAVADRLQDEGWQARVLVDDNALVDRAAAVRAGLGWYGKNANVLLPGAGSWFVLGSVLTDAPLTVGRPPPQPVADGCHSCQRCLSACPTGALVGPGQLDARRCLAWLVQAPGVFPREYREALGDRIYGCDDCQTCCPVNRLATNRQPATPPEPAAEPWIDILWLLSAPRRGTSGQARTLVHPPTPTPLPAPQRPDRARQHRGRQGPGRNREPQTGPGCCRSHRARPRRVGCCPPGPPRPLARPRQRRRPAGRRRTRRQPGLVTAHLLVTNDFPPKIGGIQSYLWELWQRLPPSDVTVLTSPHPDARSFDEAQPFTIYRTREPVLLPSPLLARRVRRLAAASGARAVILDPALPLGLIGPHLDLPYAVILHGAEVTIPGRLPGTRALLAGVLETADLLIAAGGYPEAEAHRAAGLRTLPPTVQIPPGVDTARFVPLAPIERASTRARLGLPVKGPLVLSVSRLVPRKGMDTLIAAAARLAGGGRHPQLTVAIAGSGRDRARLEILVHRTGAPVRLLGRVPARDLPALYAAADVFALCCRSRWGGLEQEGFGMVFLEAAAAGVPAVAGQSGGAAEAVVDGETGIVVADPTDVGAVAGAIDRLLSDPGLASRQGQAARQRAETHFALRQLGGPARRGHRPYRRPGPALISQAHRPATTVV